MRLDPLHEQQLRDEGALTALNLDELPLAEALAFLRAEKPSRPPPPGENVLVEDRMIGGPTGGNLPLRLYRPAAPTPLKILLHLHGGGWVGGAIANDDARCRAIAHHAGILVASLGYRLAPEYKFPAGLDDSYAALVWLHTHAGELGADPHAIAISGTSAGGNLAAATTILARDRHGPALKCQILTYPICDTSMAQPSYTENATAPLLTARMMAWFLEQYLPPSASRHDPLIAPLHAPDLRRLPPAFIVTAACDPLRDEGMAYAAKLRAAGIDATCLCAQGMTHGFLTRSPDHPKTGAATSQILASLARLL